MSNIAVVTGGAGDIGRAVVERFAKDRSGIVILDIDREAGNRTVEGFATRGVPLDFHCANLADESAV